MNTPAIIQSQSNSVEIYRMSTDAASICRDIVVATAVKLGDRKYVQIEGWQAIAIAHGCACSSSKVERVDGGVRAIGEVRRMSDGALIASAEGFVGEDEPTWYGGESITKYGRKMLPKRADYAIRAMAQTRAISRACRSSFAHVVVMMNAGLSTTPAEEVPDGGFQDAVFEDAPKSPPKAATKADQPKATTTPKHPSLSERANRVEASIRAAETLDALHKVERMASGVMAQLDTEDPERLVELQQMFRAREDEIVTAMEREPA